MSGTKRYLEEATDAVLDAVRLTGAAVLVEGKQLHPKRHEYFALNNGAEPRLLETLEVAREWMAAPDYESELRLHELRHEINSWRTGAPPDLIAEYQDLLVLLVDEFVETLNEWFAAYDLEARWYYGSLLVVPTDSRSS